jgi:tetratricopeptide (TPR) repeat protein
MLAYEQTYQLTENETTRLDAFQSYLECARAGGQLPEAVAHLQEFAKTSDPSAPAALFAIGSVLAEDREDDRAIGILESLLVAYPASPWIPAANGQLGQLYARTGKTDQAIKALNNCIGTSADPELVRTARSQLGSVLLKQTKDYAGAAAQFALISDGADASAENAAYNFLLAQAYLGKNDIFTKAEADFEKRFPKSSYLKLLALTQGRLLAGAGKTDDAKAVYRKAIAAAGTGADQEALLNALADLQYQTNDLEGTLATCNLIVAQFPNDALAAAQRGVLVSYELKKLTDDQVEQALVQLAQKYTNAPGAPEAYFRLGEFYFDHQDYVRAQDAFQQLIANYPNGADVDKAYYFAGQAAFKHQDYAAARALLEKVPDSSAFKPDARLWEGRVYQQQISGDGTMLNFNQANTFYDAVLATEKTGPRFVDASLFKGECLFALGSKDPANYSLALTTFDQILKSKEGTIADRNQADVSAGKCLEKMDRTDEAMARYLDVLYGRVAGDNAGPPAPPEFFWQFEAASQAGGIREAQKDWRGAIEVYRRAEQIGGAHAPYFHDLVNKLRRDNYIYE